MSQNRIIETMGSIAKVEKLETLNNNILENTLVLDEIEPFPGYHGANLPTGYNPKAVYLVLQKKVSTIKIVRITQSIRKYLRKDFDGVSATICINNDMLNCIRIRGIESYDIIPELQKSYMYEGMKFMKKRSITGEGVLDIKKHFKLEQIGEGIYKDLEDPLMYYLQIPKNMNWQMFHEVDTAVKRNLDNYSFDGALGAIYTREIIDVVRLFGRDISLSDLEVIRQKYLDELKKY